MDRLPPLNTLPAFVNAAQTGSISKAAEILYVTHSAVSQAIKHLESSLGVTLFDRSRRQIKLTRAGSTFLIYAEQALQQVKIGANQIERHKQSNLITVNMNTSFALGWFLSQITCFETEYPQYQLGINTPSYNVNFNEDMVDCAITRCKKPPNDLQAIKLFDEQTIIICQPNYLKRNISLKKAIQTSPLIKIDSPSSVNEWQLLCEKLGYDVPQEKQYLVFNNPLLGIQAAQNGLGLAFSNQFLARPALATGLLVQPFEQSFSTGMAYYLIYPKQIGEEKKMQIFIQWLTKGITP